MDWLRTFIRRPIFTAMLMASVVVFGLFSFPKIGVDQFPDVEFPVVTITTLLPGADPETMERDVSEKLEEAISTLSGLETLRSVNVESVSQVMVQFSLDKNVDVASQEVRDKVSAVLGELPDAVKAPVVAKFDIGAQPVMTLALSGPQPVQELTRLADDVVKQQLQRQNGVGQVSIIGGRDREIRVVADPERLRSFGLAITDLSQAIKAQSLDAPAGRLKEPGRERIMRLQGEARSAEEIGALIVASPGGSPVRVRDVAQVVDGPEEARSAARFNGVSTVAFTVLKQSGSNTVQVAENVKEALPDIQKLLPAGARISEVRDGARFIRASIDGVQEDLVVGAFLAVLIVLVFLRNGRSTIIAAVALPTSVIGTFAVMHALGFTFNMITMLALTLSIGLLIDDAIVVIENIIRHIELGQDPKEAAFVATKQIAVAVLAVTLAIVAVFIPVAFMEGMIGRFFFQFGVTVAVAVIISYVVSMTLTPMMAAYLLRHEHSQGRVSQAIERVLTGLERAYERFLRVLLRHRFKTVAAAVGVLVLTVLMVPLLKFSFIPPQDQGTFMVYAELPVGTPLERTEREVAKVAEQLRAIPGVTDVYESTGGGQQELVNKGELTVNLLPVKQRKYTQQQIQQYVRDTVAAPPDVMVTVGDFSPFAGQRSQQVQFSIRGNDWKAVQESAAKVKAAMLKHGGFVDVDSSYRGGKPQIDVTLDRERAALLGVPAGQVASTLRAFLGGDEVTTFRDAGDTYSIRLALPDAVRADPEAMGALTVRGTNGALVELRNLTVQTPGEGPSQIDRSSRQREILMLANLRTGTSLGEAMSFLTNYAQKELPPTVQAGFEGNAKELARTGIAFMSALLLGMVLVYMILAAQFESLLDPLVIMASLPFAIIGAIGGLLVTGEMLSIFSMIGVIMLMGLVVKNGILLVEFAVQLKHEEGKSTFDALVEAGRVRLRPILMTTIAMIAGMIPVALARGDGAESRVGMAVVIIGGLITSTVLTLGVVPVVYSLVDGLRARVTRRKATAPAHGHPTPVASTEPAEEAGPALS